MQLDVLTPTFRRPAALAVTLTALAAQTPEPAHDRDPASRELPSPLVDVLMPTFEQSAFIVRAIRSLLEQRFTRWSLTIVDDGSEDDTHTIVAPFVQEPRIHYVRLPVNRGLGAALNLALDTTSAPYVAYLPSDDVWYHDHLASLVDRLEREPAAVAAFSGVRHHYNGLAEGAIEGESLQLVQVAHRRTDDRFLARGELVTDDLDRMFWSKLRSRGAFVGTGLVSCEWVDHPAQLHKVLREPVGGINPYRVRYRVREPLRFHSTRGNFIDEVEQYREFRARPKVPRAEDGLRILLVGELAYNADRVLALEERGHALYGLWMRDPYWYNTVGPLPFGHVQDLDVASWRREIERVTPDVIYALLNWQAVPFAHEVMLGTPGIPFVWHFKEGPFICLEKGTWNAMMDLYRRADGRIYCSEEMGDWFATLGLARDKPTLVLDGDLPKREWFGDGRSPRLSDEDGEIHTCVPGRPIGLHPPDVAALAAQGIHLHFYGDFTQGQWLGWIEKTRALAGRFLHLHDNVDARGWVRAFSRYDAGWLHFFASRNGGEIARADWDDLDVPARMSTLAAAGLPMLQRDNDGAIVATQRIARELDAGIFFTDMSELGALLRDRARVETLRSNVWNTRHLFTFDHHADRLVAFFRTVIEAAGPRT